MASVRELLQSLQANSQRSPSSVRATLLELVSCCRHEDAKAALLVAGVDSLVALAFDAELARGDTLEVLFELLVLLIVDNTAAKTKVAHCGAMELAVKTVRGLVAGIGPGIGSSVRSTGARSSRRRVKILKLALEMIGLLAHTAQAQQLQEQVFAELLGIMARSGQDASVLFRAVDVFGRFVDGSLDRIQLAVSGDAIPILIELLKLSEEKMDLKRTVCDVLVLLGEAPGILQLMVAQNIVGVLCTCLRVETPGREVEVSVVRLLLRLAREARVYGQIVHEEMVPLLFQVIERNSNIREVTATACTLIADLSDFARQCKLDLSPFLETASCRGKVLVLAATCHAQDAAVVDSTFRFFVNVSWNPVDLPQLINPETIEGLLSLYVLAGGSGYLAELAEHLVHVISRLSRLTIEQFTIQEEDVTLPALFLCLRNYHEDVRFASQVFAILTKYWKTQVKSVHSITGYVGIAIEVLCRTIPDSQSWTNEIVEICNFVREMMLSKDGAEVVLSCGGKELLELLHTHLPPQEQDHPPGDAEAPSEQAETRAPTPQLLLQLSGDLFEGKRLVLILVDMLEKALLGCPELAMLPSSSLLGDTYSVDKRIETLPATAVVSRRGDDEYEEFVACVLRRESTCLFKDLGQAALVHGFNHCTLDAAPPPMVSHTRPDGPPEGQTYSVTFDHTGHENGVDYNFCGIPRMTEARAVVADMTADSAATAARDHAAVHDVIDSVESDADDEELDTEAVDEGNDDDSDEDDGCDKADGVEDITEPDCVPAFALEVIRAPPDVRVSSSCKSTRRGDSTSNPFAHLEDKTWYFVDSSRVKYPKHPERMKRDDHNNHGEAFILSEPDFDEPCISTDPEEAARFVEEAMLRRTEFVASDVNTRARIVYENTSMLEDRRREKVAGIPEFLQNTCVAPNHSPYFVPEKPKAFPNMTSSLTFDSHFESGNLERAIRIGEYEYDLVLRRDFNSSGHMQWFYFAVSNIQPPNKQVSSPRGGQKYRFNIVNLCKPNSLFNQGLQPVVYSVKDAHQKGQGWVRAGTDIYYFANPFARAPKPTTTGMSGTLASEAAPAATSLSSCITSAALAGTYYTLTFTLEFRNSDDTYLIAHSYPYTLLMHQLHLNSVLHRSGRDTRKILRHTALCTTLSGRSCDLLTISDFSAGQQEVKVRRAVFLTSRVHPGEAQASWMMRGVIDFLLGDSEIARVLRRMFVFQIIPILNPDGVYYGNSRCALSACDLNRQWQSPSKTHHPTIFHAKELLVKERSTRGVVFFCDIHGHSRKKNVFMYGCDTKRRPNPLARTFAKLFAVQQTAKKYISFPDCSFKVSKDKETTARVVVANELKISWSFTLEASFCGANFGQLQNTHFNTRHLHQVGTSLCETLYQACITDPSVQNRLAEIVHDATVCFPRYVECYLREAGIVNDGYPPVDNSATTGSASTRTISQKGKSKKTQSETPLKAMVRKNSRSRAVGNTDSGVIRSGGDADEPFIRQRKPSRQQNKSALSTGLMERADAEVRDASITTYVTDGTASRLDLAGLPRSKMSGKKLRSKYPRSRRTKSSPDGLVKSHRKAMPRLSASEVEGAENLEGQTSANDRAGSSSSASSGASIDPTMPLVPTKPVATAAGPPTSSVRVSFTTFQSPDGAYVRSPKSASIPFPSSNVLGLQVRDSSMVLPPPVSDLVSRSPKAPVNRIRFRGAGRQFAAVNTIPKTSIHDILKSDSVTSFQSYEADLISASTMVIRHRASVSANNHNIGSNNPATAVDDKVPSSSSSGYLSFPSVT